MSILRCQMFFKTTFSRGIRLGPHSYTFVGATVYKQTLGLDQRSRHVSPCLAYFSFAFRVETLEVQSLRGSDDLRLGAGHVKPTEST